VIELNLSHCTGITDISALGNVFNLDIEGCTNISRARTLSLLNTIQSAHDQIISPYLTQQAHFIDKVYRILKILSSTEELLRLALV
jgi:hypothetical protein